MPPLSDRYALLSPLGAGTTSTVFRARDLETGAEVAVKRLTLTDEASRLMFQHEYWTMRRLQHPGLVEAFGYGREDGGEDGGDWLAMALVAGEPVPAGPLAPEAFASVMAPLCQVVGYLHAQGFVHGDLKPDNARFDAEGRLRLLDLGFLQPAGRPGLRRGTLEYMGPEVLKGEPADPRSDVYALGVMAYAWLTGRLPFTAAHPLALLQAQLSETPEPVSALRPELPAPVAEAVMAALAKAPADRPPTAGHLLARMGLGQADTAFLIFGSAHFGRDEAVTALRAHVAAQLEGHEAALSVLGASGLGKSRLLLEATEPGRGPARLSAAGQGDVPYQLATRLLEAAEPLMAERGLAPGDARWQALRALMPHWGEAPAALDPRNQENRLRQAVAVLFAAMAAPDGLLVAIDDWDLADRASADLLAPLTRRPNDAKLAWVLAGREAASDGPTLALSPLDDAAIADLLESVLDQAPSAELARLTAERAQGNPALVRELLRHWLDAGALSREAGEWRLDAARARQAVAGGGRAADALAGAGEGARRLARAGAVLGHAFSLADATHLVEGDLFGPLADLEAGGLVVRQGDRCQFVGLAREAALAALPDDEARALHAQAAALYEGATDLAGLTQAARHLLAAGLAGAGETVLAAVRAALAQGALATARELLEAFAAQPAPPATRQEVARLQGDVARLTGRGADALAHYEAAIALARELNDEAALSRELVSAGRTAMMVSDAPRARAFLDEALPLNRAIGNRGQEARALMTLGRVSYFGAGDHQAAREAYVEAKAIASAAGELALKADAASFLGLLSAPTDPQGRADLLEALDLHRQLHNPLGVIEASINLGDRRLAAGDLAGAREVFEEALLTCRQVGSVNEEAFVRLNLSQTSQEQGRLAEALDHAERAFALADALAQGFPAGYAKALAAQALWRLGRYAEADAALAACGERAEAAKSKYLEAVWRMASGQLALELGRADAAQAGLDAAEAAFREMGDPGYIARAVWLQGRLAILRGDHDAARARLAEAAETAEQQSARVLDALIRVSAARLALDEGHAEQAATLADAARGAAQAIGADEIAAEAEVALAEAGLAQGAREAAERHALAALRYARQAGATLLEALASLAAGRSGQGGTAAEFTRRGERLLRQLAVAGDREAFFGWRERRLEAAPAGAPAVGLAEAVAFLQDMRQAAGLHDLLTRLLDRMMAVSRAEAGALLGYRAMQLDQVATQFLKEADVATLPMLDDALWDHRAVFEGDRWALPVLDGEELVAVLYLEAAEAGRREVVTSLAEGLGLAIGQFMQLQRFQERVERLAFSEALAKQALYGRAPGAILADALVATLAITTAERALLLKVAPNGEFEVAMGMGADGRPLPTDTPFSRSISSWVVSTRETVRLMDAQQMEQWQHQQSILALGLHTIVAVPLKDGEAVTGVLYVDSADVVNMLGEREQGLLEAAAEVLSPLLARL